MRDDLEKLLWNSGMSDITLEDAQEAVQMAYEIGFREGQDAARAERDQDEAGERI